MSINHRVLHVALSIALLPAGMPAQTRAAVTAEQVLERSIEATGGREAHERLASYELEGAIEVARRGIRGTLVMRAKAPDRLLVVRTIEKVGEIKQGYDGKTGWAEDPYNGSRTLDGEELEIARRGAVYNAELRWRTLFERAELLGVEKLGGRDVYAVRLEGKDAATETRYYDVATFLLVRTTTVYEGSQGRIPIETRYEDYREVDGVKVAHLWTHSTPAGEMTVRVGRVRFNVAIPDADFAPPTSHQFRP